MKSQEARNGECRMVVFTSSAVDGQYGSSVLCWAIWNIRNNVTFDGHKMRTPCGIIFFASTLLICWVGLERVGDKERVVSGA